MIDNPQYMLEQYEEMLVGKLTSEVARVIYENRSLKEIVREISDEINEEEITKEECEELNKLRF